MCGFWSPRAQVWAPAPPPPGWETLDKAKARRVRARLRGKLPELKGCPVHRLPWWTSLTRFLPLLYIRLWLVISHLLSSNPESINLSSFVEQKYLFVLADKVLFLCQKAELTGQSSRATRSTDAESWNSQHTNAKTVPFFLQRTRRNGLRGLREAHTQDSESNQQSNPRGKSQSSKQVWRFYDTIQNHYLKKMLFFFRLHHGVVGS